MILRFLIMIVPFLYLLFSIWVWNTDYLTYCYFGHCDNLLQQKTTLIRTLISFFSKPLHWIINSNFLFFFSSSDFYQRIIDIYTWFRNLCKYFGSFLLSLYQMSWATSHHWHWGYLADTLKNHHTLQNQFATTRKTTLLRFKGMELGKIYWQAAAEPYFA